MRIYVFTGRGPMRGRWIAWAPEIPGAASSDLATREEALERCRRRAIEEREALERLGAPPDVDRREVVVDWEIRSSLIPESLLPMRPALVGAVVRRLDELAEELDRDLAELGPEEWDRRPDGGWSVRMTLDHIASGFGELLRSLEPWPLEPGRAQAAAVEELRARLEQLADQRFVVEQFGMNQENGRVCWTPRKVLRVVRGLQEAWLAHLSGDGPEPTFLMGHEDVEDDDRPVQTSELEALERNDVELRSAADLDVGVTLMGFWYRYYRDRLISWPRDPVERWHAMRGAFRERLLGLDEGELARIRVAPNGTCSTVNQVASLSISHLQEHRDQMRQARRTSRSVPRRQRG